MTAALFRCRILESTLIFSTYN